VSEETIEGYGCCLQFFKHLFPMGLGTYVYEYYFHVELCASSLTWWDLVLY